MKAVIHKTGAIGEVLGIERRDDGIDYVYFESGLCKPISEVGFLNPYEQYMEDWSDLEDFRREAAKDILCALIGHKNSGVGTFSFDSDAKVEKAIAIADRLINRLK